MALDPALGDGRCDMVAKQVLRLSQRGLAKSMLLTGETTELIRDDAEQSSTTEWNFLDWYDQACLYATASSKLTDTNRKKEYADLTIELVQLAIQSGWKDFAQLETDEELSTVRDRGDFLNLVETSNPSSSLPASNNGASEGSQPEAAAQ